MGFEQIYLTAVLFAAVDAKLCTRLLYFHGTRLFAISAAGQENVPLRRLLALFRVFGVSELHTAQVCRDFSLQADEPLTKDVFLTVCFDVFDAIDRNLSVLPTAGAAQVRTTFLFHPQLR